MVYWTRWPGPLLRRRESPGQHPAPTRKDQPVNTLRPIAYLLLALVTVAAVLLVTGLATWNLTLH